MNRQAGTVPAGSFLCHDVEIRADEGTPYLFHKRAKIRRPLTVPEALCLSLSAAIDDPNEIVDALTDYTDGQWGASLVACVIERYRTYLCGKESREPDLSWVEDLDPARLKTEDLCARSSVPESLTWVVTHCCHRRCVYCNAPVRDFPVLTHDSPPDATFPLSAVLRLIDQMAVSGTPDLHLTGGEPLLRKDLTTIIESAARRRIRVHLITKYPVNASLAGTLAEAGLYRATVSLDDARADRVAKLAGHRYLCEAKESIKALSAHLPVTVHAVVTQINHDGLEELARLALDLGAVRFTFSPLSFSGNAGRHMQSLLPEQSDWGNMEARLAEHFSGRLEIAAVGAPVSSEKEGETPRLVCDSGVRTLHVLPDGRVTRCLLLPHRPDLVVGDLCQQDLMEVWRGQRIEHLVAPSPELFEGTACADCPEFDRCNVRGRCYLQAVDLCGGLYGPDPFCSRKQRI